MYPAGMRLALAAVATTAALSLVPAAGAAFGPPLASIPSTLHSLPIVAVRDAESRAPSTCSTHARRSSGTVGRIERKLAPVACEQPPRAKLLDAGFGFFFRLSH
jgi:hypothetical protein